MSGAVSGEPSGPAPGAGPAPAGWHGWASIAPGRLYYGGRIGTAELHAHHAAQLLIGHGLVLGDAAGAERAVTAALIPPNTPHAIVRGTADGLLALIDPFQAGPARPGPGPRPAAAWAIDLDVPARRDLPTLRALVGPPLGFVRQAPK